MWEEVLFGLFGWEFGPAEPWWCDDLYWPEWEDA